MFPAFGPGDRLQLDQDVAHLERGDIVSHRLSDPGGSEPLLYVHRVVGLPGERLEAAEDGGLLVNGVPLVEDYLPAGTTTPFVEPVDVPTDHYFVLGDNRERSSDSRVLGSLPRSAIVARVTKVVPVTTDEDDACP
jgi:signal peptidase I